MNDYSRFKYGAVISPLPLMSEGAGDAADLLRDADPALFYLLEFCASIIKTHIGPRLLEEAHVVGIDHIKAAVAEVLPLDPEQYLVENQVKFPLLCAYRKNTRPDWVGTRKLAVDEVDVVYVLPPLQAGEAERLIPILRAVHRLLDNRIDIGFDPAYAPTAPDLPAGTSFWIPAGLTSCGVMGASYGGYAATDRLYFPAVTLNVQLKERNEYVTEDFPKLDPPVVHVDIASSTEATLPDAA